MTLRGISVAGALEDVSVHAPAGSVVAVVGPNGAGKSTLLGLVARLLDPDSGDVLIDGTRVKDLRLSSLRRTVSMVGPDLPLLRGSLERNVRYRRRRASARSVARVCARCGVDEVAARLPRGLATPVADAGVNLSAGERTRVALARALLGRPGVLLLDEADAHLDRRGAARLDSVIDAYDGTVIMITHDPARAVGADLVWHLEGGRLVAAGPPAELARLDSPTSRLLDGYRLEAVA